MKRGILILGIALIIGACQSEVRYTQKAPEIDAVLEMLKKSASGDFDGQRAYYAENAQIFYNVPEDQPSTVDQLIENQKSEMGDFGEVSITIEDEAIELVTTDKGEKWVNCWGTWKAKHLPSGKSFEVPFHETFQFVDGKIVKDFGYWDNTPVVIAIMEYEKAQMAASDTIPAN